MEEKTIRILLADDHEVLRDGLQALINRQPDMDVVAAVGSGRSVVEQARMLQPDVIVMDIGMPDLNGIDATRQITTDSCAGKVLCLSMHKEQSLIGAMLQAGASGYLVKNCAGRELVDAIRTVASGHTYISPMIADEVVEGYVRKRSDPGPNVYSELSGREREILQLIAEGRNTKEIADQLAVSEKTVAAHRLNLMKKLDLHSIADLTRYAIRQGLVEP
ncbi:MAG: response regulator transcription factor [bacterium]